MVTVFYFLDGFTLSVPGDHLDAWEEVKRGERAGFLVRPAVGQSVDVGAAYRVEVKPGNQ